VSNDLQDIFEIDIDAMVFGGYGLGRVDGRVIFVSRAYPGERIKAKIYKKKRGTFFAEPVEILRSSEFRRKPSCPAFGACGGCAHQDIDYEKQFEYKLDVVLDAMSRIGGFDKTPAPELIPAETEFHYRNKMEFGFAKDVNGELFLGQHRRGRFDRFVPAENCMLMPTMGTEILESIKRKSLEMELEPYDIREDSGLLRYVPLRFSETNGDYICSITVRRKEPKLIGELLRHVQSEIPGMSAGVMIVNTRTGDTAQGDEYHLVGCGFIEEEIAGITFRISPSSFFQTNTVMARRFYDRIVEFAELTGEERVIDLYCGTGTIAQLVSSKAQRILGIESVEAAILDARESAERNGISNIEFVCDRVENAAKTVFDDFEPDVVILDPPRSGMAGKSLKRLLDYTPQALIYASCNPTTLARDLAILAEKYDFVRFAVIDMFPQTYHIECVTRLELRR